MRLAGAGIEIDERSTVEIGQVLSIRRPGELIGRIANERPMPHDGFNREWPRRSLRRSYYTGEADAKGNEKRRTDGTRQKKLLQG
jgi:hypothetical protein